MFYLYSQNNSNGQWKGEYRAIIVEANDSVEAEAIAATHGVYFGWERGDCVRERCCGNRWEQRPQDETFDSVEDALEWVTYPNEPYLVVSKG